MTYTHEPVTTAVSKAVAGPAAPLEALLALLEVEAVERDLFRAFNRADLGSERLFGGLIAAQALRAAQLTTPVNRPVHSLHSYFVRSGRTGVPVVMRVTRVRDGRSFTTREVTAIQDGKTIYTVVASFHDLEDGPEQSSPLPAVVELPPPSAVIPAATNSVRLPIDTVELVPLSHPWHSGESAYRALFRPRGAKIEDPALSACLLTYMTDLNAAFAVCRAAGFSPEHSMLASLDHSIWFHRPLRWNDWLVMDLRPMANASARGLVVGTVHRPDGTHVASMTQEALYRDLRKRPLQTEGAGR
jgi:acyl-CoA thioesterase-2